MTEQTHLEKVLNDEEERLTAIVEKLSLRIRNETACLTEARAQLSQVLIAQAALRKPTEPRRPHGRHQWTIKDMVVRVLSAQPETSMTVAEIMEAVRFQFGVDIPRTTLSPQISRLCRSGDISREGRGYAAVPGGSD